MAETSEAIVSYQALKPVLAIRENDQTHDDKLKHLVMVATLEIENATHRRFTKQVFTENFNSWETVNPIKYYLKARPIDTNTAPVVYYSPGRTYTAEEVVSPDNYYIDPQTGIMEFYQRVGRYPKSIRVVYTGGYESVEKDGFKSLETNAPPDLKEACIMQTMAWIIRRRPDNAGLTGDRQHAGGESLIQSLDYAVKGGITPEVQGLLRPYRRILVGGA